MSQFKKVAVIGTGVIGTGWIIRFLAHNKIVYAFDKISLSNIHRQGMYNSQDVGKLKVDVIYTKIKKIDPDIKIIKHKVKITNKNFDKIAKKYDVIIDGTDNFRTKFLLNEGSLKLKKFFISGSISRFDGHIFTFDFKNKNEPCLKCFYQELPLDDVLNCESDGILGPVAGVVGNLQAIEAIKKICHVGKNLSSNILILNLKDLKFRKVKFKKKKNCIC